MKKLLWINWYLLIRKMKIVGFHFGRNNQLEQKHPKEAEKDFVYTTVVINLKSKRSGLSIKKHLWPGFDKD